MERSRLSRRNPIDLLLMVLLFAGPARAAVTATWIGGSSGNFSDPANWSAGVVPVNADGTTYNVIIPGGVVVNYDLDDAGTLQDLSVGAGSRLVLKPGTSLAVLDDAAIGGSIEAERSVFTAAAPGAAFSGNRSTVSATGGAKVTILGTSYSSTGLASDHGGNYLLFNAQGAGSTIDLSAVQMLDARTSSWGNSVFQTIRATHGGRIDLSSLQSILGPASPNCRLDILLSNDGEIDLSNLQSIDGTGQTRFVITAAQAALPRLQTADRVTFDMGARTLLSLPKLVTFANGAFSLQDGALATVGQLQSLANTPVTLAAGSWFDAPELLRLSNSPLSLASGSTFNAPKLTHVSDAVLSFSPNHTIHTGMLTEIDNARLSVWGGIQFDKVSDTSYWSTRWNDSGTLTLFSADGVGSRLNLSSLKSLHASFNDGSHFIRVNLIRAGTSAQIDLSGLEMITAPPLTQDRLDFVAEAGGTIRLDNLQSITGRGIVRFVAKDASSLTLPSLKSFNVGDQVTFSLRDPAVTFPQLVSASGADFALPDTSTLNLPALTHLERAVFSLPSGATVHAPSLTSIRQLNLAFGSRFHLAAPSLTQITHSTLHIGPGQLLTTGGLSSIDNTRLLLTGGARLENVTDTSYDATGLWSTTSLLADGAGTVLDLSSVKSFNGAYFENSASTAQWITASAGGHLDLSGVQSITGPGSGDDALVFGAYSGGTIDLSGLKGTSSSAGWIHFTVSGGGRISFGDLIVGLRNTVTLSDTGSSLDVAGDFLLDAGQFTAGTGTRVYLHGNLGNQATSETKLQLGSTAVHFVGVQDHFLEVAGIDAGNGDPLNNGNFGLGRLIVGEAGMATTLRLQDLMDNGNRAGDGGPAEALYLFGAGGLDGLSILGGSTFVLNSLNVYSRQDAQWFHLNSLFAEGVTTIPFDRGYLTLHMPEPATLLFLAAGFLARGCRRPHRRQS